MAAPWSQGRSGRRERSDRPRRSSSYWSPRSPRTDWLRAALGDGRQGDALAGATAYQRLFGLTLTGVYLARGGLVDAGDGKQVSRIAFCRFAAENLLAETAEAIPGRRVLGGDFRLGAP